MSVDTLGNLIILRAPNYGLIFFRGLTMKIGLPTLGALLAAFILTSISSTPADARTVCKGSGTSAKCYTVKAKKKFAKRTRASRYAQRARARTARYNRDDYPWHGWGASFHLHVVRSP